MKVAGFFSSPRGYSAWAVCSGIVKMGRVNRGYGLRKDFSPPAGLTARRIRARRKPRRIRAARNNRARSPLLSLLGFNLNHDHFNPRHLGHSLGLNTKPLLYSGRSVHHKPLPTIYTNRNNLHLQHNAIEESLHRHHLDSQSAHLFEGARTQDFAVQRVSLPNPEEGRPTKSREHPGFGQDLGLLIRTRSIRSNSLYPQLDHVLGPL